MKSKLKELRKLSLGKEFLGIEVVRMQGVFTYFESFEEFKKKLIFFKFC